MTDEQYRSTLEAIKLLKLASKRVYGSHVFGGGKDACKPIEGAIEHLERSTWRWD